VDCWQLEAAGLLLGLVAGLLLGSVAAEVHPGFTLPVVTGPVTAVTGLTGLDRLRYRPVTNRRVQKFLNLNSKN
jgi:hypothetical protein